VALIAVPAASGQTTWHVDDDAPNDPAPGDPTISDPFEDGSAEHPFDAIQEGIDAATDGDTVLVADGTYTGVGNKNLDYAGKAIAVRSENGPDTCVIDCENDGRGIFFSVKETADAIIDGVTITNGSAERGGGIYCYDGCSPTITNCTIVGNTAEGVEDSGMGGGIYCYGSPPTISNCTIVGNTARSANGPGYGAGVACRYSNPTITNCTISENTAGGADGYGIGGGLFCYESSPMISDCTISENTAGGADGGYGGGVYCSYSNPTISNCTISENTVRASEEYGGSEGGGVFCHDSNPVITNCVILRNTAGPGEIGFGGGVYCDDSSAMITNCTIRENVTNGTYGGRGGGVYCRDDNGTTITNCILWGDVPDEVYGSPATTCSNIEGGWEGEGNIDADPGFALPGDCHLMQGSPCIDTGTNEPPGGLPAGDLDGNPRPLDGDGDSTALGDMGAYEFNPDVPSIAVSPSVLEFFVAEGDSNTHSQILSVRNCGGGTLNWEVETPSAWLQVDPPAGQSNGEIDEIVVSAAAGELPYGEYESAVTISDPAAVNSPRIVRVVLYVYTTLHVPDEYETIQAGIDASHDGDVILVADGTYTGPGNKDLDFGGKRVTIRSENGPENCIIDCEGEGRGFYFHNGEDADSIVDGLTIRNGYLTGVEGPVTGAGGAVYCDSSDPTIADCVLSGNTAAGSHEVGVGGAVYCGNASPTITGCMVTANTAESGGGGIYSMGNSSPVIANCVISENAIDYPKGSGGGICYQGSGSLLIVNCAISGNTLLGPYGGGGGIRCGLNDYGSATIVNCTISENYSGGRAGGISSNSGNTAIINCTIVRNWADDYGGGVCCGSDNTTIANCILWDNAPDNVYGSPAITYSDIEGGWEGEGNIAVAPAFAFPGDFHLMAGSPCIDAGTNDPTGGLPADDLDGNPRPLDGDGDSTAVADMGAYEFNPGAPCIAASSTVLEFFVFEDDPNTHSQVFSIRNCGGGTLNWEVEAPCAWLQADPPTGQSNGEIDDVLLTANVAGMSFGRYECEVTVSDPAAVNSPRTVSVVLYVNTIRHVPDAYETIQAAIDASLHGDIVLLADGTYTGPGNKDLDFGGKRITIRSDSGPTNCIIDCEGDGRGFYFHNGEDADSVVNGLTIRNGYACRGSGVYCCYHSSPTLINCTISGNAATGGSSNEGGGGVYCYSSAPTITGCTISGNVVTIGSGGGLFFKYSDAEVTNCTISDNAASYGGGLYLQSGSTTVTNCLISGNMAEGTEWGGDGGGIRCRGAATITNCTISANTAVNGAGFYIYTNVDVAVTNCTIIANSADAQGGGLRCYLGCDVSVTNSILWNNSAMDGAELALVNHDELNPALTVMYADVEGGESAAYVENGCTLIWGSGNINADPLFVDPDGPDDDPNTWRDNDCHLSAGSPCIDAGCNCAVPEDFADLDGDGILWEYRPFDLDGEGRFFDDPDTPDSGSGLPPIVDMGAYEFGGSDLPPCHGDLDGDRDVDLDDLAVLLAHYGMSEGANGADGDMDCDGDIQIADLAEFLGAYGDVCE